MNDETHYRLLKFIEANPKMSQRELANAMGVSLGKINYCLQAVIERGWIKAKNFTESKNKRAYTYYLTSKGATEKSKVTARFLKNKIQEYQDIKKQIKELRQEVERMDLASEEADK